MEVPQALELGAQLVRQPVDAGEVELDEVRRLFGRTVALQQAAFAALRPGATCADVDGAVMQYLEANGIRDLWRQHTGHGIVMPQCHHGGPGRAGNGEELGGLNGLRLYHQRVAVQGSSGVLAALQAGAGSLH